MACGCPCWTGPTLEVCLPVRSRTFRSRRKVDTNPHVPHRSLQRLEGTSIGGSWSRYGPRPRWAPLLTGRARPVAFPSQKRTRSRGCALLGPTSGQFDCRQCVDDMKAARERGRSSSADQAYRWFQRVLRETSCRTMKRVSRARIVHTTLSRHCVSNAREFTKSRLSGNRSWLQSRPV